jgi:hypothetical protein
VVSWEFAGFPFSPVTMNSRRSGPKTIAPPLWLPPARRSKSTAIPVPTPFAAVIRITWFCATPPTIRVAYA